MSTLQNFINDFLQSTTDDDSVQAMPPRRARGLFGRKVELPPPPPPTLVESLKKVLKKVDVVTHLQWAAVAGLMLLTFYHVYMQYTAAKDKKTSASSETKAKARSWLSSITKSGEERATEAVPAPAVDARTVATPESKPPPMSRAKSVRKAAAKITGMSGAFSGKKKADAVPKAEKAAAADAKGRTPAAATQEASATETVVAKVEETTDKAEAAAATKVDEAAAAAKTEAKDQVDAASEKLGVDAPPVSMEVIDQAAELTKGKVAEGGAATDDAVKKAVVGPAQ